MTRGRGGAECCRANSGRGSESQNFKSLPLNLGEDTRDTSDMRSLMGFCLFFSEVQSKSFFDRDRRDLLAIPEAIVSYVQEAVNKVYPKISQFYLDTVQSPTVIAARYGSLFCTNAPMAMSEKGEGGVGERIDYSTICMGRSDGTLIRNQSLMYQWREVLEDGVGWYGLL